MAKGGSFTDREKLISACDGSLRLLRAEAGLTQDGMAQELGISKKTLVGIEKGRSSLGWTGSAALCLLFGDSPTLRRRLAGDPRQAAAKLRMHPTAETTEDNTAARSSEYTAAPPRSASDTPALSTEYAAPIPPPDASPAVQTTPMGEPPAAPPGTSPLWRCVARFGRFTAEQNVISEHYRLIDPAGRRVFASFDYSEVEAVAARLNRSEKHKTKGEPTDEDT